MAARSRGRTLTTRSRLPSGVSLMPAAPSSCPGLSRPIPVRPEDDRFVPLAAELGAQCAERAAVHDRENSFVAENFRLLRESGYAALGVPEVLGGGGASMRQVCYAQA